MNNLYIPEVSVIMSIYNEPYEWITTAIDSILHQTYANLELLIVNDKPDRKTNIEFLRDISKKDKRIRIIHNEQNIGLAASLNKAAKLAQGIFLARMDADDISEKNRFQIQVEFLKRNPQIGVVGSWVTLIDGDNNTFGKIIRKRNHTNLINSLYFFTPFVHPTVMMRKVVWSNFHYDENLRLAEDWNLWLRCSQFTEFANIQRPLLYYRVHENQTENKIGVYKSNSSKIYSDTIFVKEIGIPDNFSLTFIKSRGGEYVSINELNDLYGWFFSVLNRGQKIEAMRSFLRQLKNFKMSEIIFNKQIFSNPIIFLQAVVNDVLLLFRQRY